MTQSVSNDEDTKNALEDIPAFSDKIDDLDEICKDDTVIKDIAVNLVLFCVEPMEDLDTLQAGDASIVVNQ